MMHDEAVRGYRLIFGYLGIIWIIIGIITMIPLTMLVFFPNEINQMQYFVFPGLMAILVGYLMYQLIRKKPKGQLEKHQDTIIVLLSWISAIFITALPFRLTGQYTMTQAVFECSSAWSTTGLTIVDVDHCPNIFLFHRSTVLFFGGIGLVLLMVSVLSDRYGMRLYSAEGHGDKLLPNLVKSSRLIITIYAGYILAGMLLYMICGMNWFDAINHSIAALSTGGFSTHSENIGYYDSVSIEIVSILLMLLGNINFLAHLFLLRGKFKTFFQYCEVRFSLFVLAFFIPFMFGGLMIAFPYNVSQGVRVAVFQAVSALTTTGFQNIPTFATWPSFLVFLMILLQLIGGGTGSTAGGIKQFRVYVLCKNIYWNIRDQLTSRFAVHADKINRPGSEEYLGYKEKHEISSFVFLYLCVFFLGTLILCAFGYSVEASMFEFSSALGTVGLSIGITSPDAHPIILWVESIGMVVGRLEIYVVLLALARARKDLRLYIQEKKKKRA